MFTYTRYHFSGYVAYAYHTSKVICNYTAWLIKTKIVVYWYFIFAHQRAFCVMCTHMLQYKISLRLYAFATYLSEKQSERRVTLKICPKSILTQRYTHNMLYVWGHSSGPSTEVGRLIFFKYEARYWRVSIFLDVDLDECMN